MISILNAGSAASTGAKEVRGLAATSDDMIKAIEMWEQMYRGVVPWRVKNQKWLNLPPKIAREISTKVTNEAKIRIQPSEEENGTDGLSKAPAASEEISVREGEQKPLERWEYIDRVFHPVRKYLSVFTEYACAFGGICFKPYINGNGEIAIGVFNASRFYPTSFNAAREIQSGFFIEQKKQDDRWYCRVELHEWDGVSKYTVRNSCYKSQNENEIGNPCPLDEVADWQNIQPEVRMDGVYSPLFSYFGIPLGNTVDQTSPLGVSVYNSAIDSIRDADVQYQSLMWEFEGGELAVDISEDALAMINGKLSVPAGKERLFRTNGIPVTAGGGLLQAFAPSLRDASYINGLQTVLKNIEDDCSLSRGTFSDPEKDARTAEEIRMQKQRTYEMVSKIQKSLHDALHRLAHAVDDIATLYNLCKPGKWSFSADWDDSIIIDSNTERMNDRDDVAAGLMMDWEYRVKWYGETEEEAKRKLESGKEKTDDQILGFSVPEEQEPGPNDGNIERK